MGERQYRIGELAKVSGVSAKTIRFYSDSGILPPTALTPAGYRLYSEADRARLETIRVLRELAFPLSAIAALLGQQRSVTDALHTQLAALETTLRTVRRHHLVLRAAVTKGEGAALAYLDHAHVHARLNAIERQALLDTHLTRIFTGVAADEGWKATFWQAVVCDLPEELSEAQFAAWLELAELVTDEGFITRLNEIGRAAWGSDTAPRRNATLHDLYAAASAAHRAGHPPDDAAGRVVIDEYLARGAATLGRDPADPLVATELLDEIARNDEPRAARYWELIAILKEWPPSPIPAAHAWLTEGLRLRAAATRTSAADEPDSPRR